MKLNIGRISISRKKKEFDGILEYKRVKNKELDKEADEKDFF